VPLLAEDHLPLPSGPRPPTGVRGDFPIEEVEVEKEESEEEDRDDGEALVAAIFFTATFFGSVPVTLPGTTGMTGA
jgi:hypothetical protein